MNNLTQKEAKRMQKQLDKHYEYLNSILSKEVLEIVDVIVFLEIELEQECGQ